MKNSALKKVKPDAKGRISLGKLAKDVDLFEILEDKNGRIILTPHILIPKNQSNLYKNFDTSKITKEINDELSYDEYNMGTNWKEIESVKFPETEEIELELIVDEENTNDLNSWN